MRVIGIDPGYAIVGFGALEYKNSSFKALRYGAVTTKSHTDFSDRLLEIYNDLTQVISEEMPDFMAIESLYFTSNQKTAMAVAQARGVILLAAKKLQVPVFEYTPKQVKQSVSGYGNASKKQVQEMTRRILNLQSIPKPDDAADALAIAVCHAYSFNSLQYGLGKTKRQSQGYY